MKTEDHFRLAVHLKNGPLKDLPFFSKLAFILGSVEPDINLFTYLLGWKIRFFYGHHWSNAKNYLKNKLQKTAHTQKVNWFSVGRLVHFTADAFTYTHNSYFVGGFLKHTKYEKELHPHFIPVMTTDKTYTDKAALDLEQYVLKRHKEYMLASPSVKTDTEFILSAVNLMTNHFLQKATTNKKTATTIPRTQEII